MIHLGDITKIDGYKVPIVDCVVGGSPCQDLSVAGKRAGLDGERSGLFMEQLRVIKEMRERDRQNGRTDEHIRPRYMVWENVPGAFSSNKAEDFRIVLEETAKVKDPDAVIPMPDSGKWTTSGCILGDGWSIAWRVCDAQFYGVPQRRRRIALIADFGGQSAPEILFVRKSVSRDTEQSESKGKETTTNATRSIGANDSQCFCFEPGIASREVGHTYEDVSGTIRAKAGDNQMAIAYSVENHPADSRVDIDQSGKVQTLTSRMGTGGGNVPMVMECYSKSKRAQTDTDYETWKESDVANTLNAFDVGDKRTTECVVALDRASFNQGINAKQSNMAHSLNGNNVIRTKYIVRRLTPLECERLQGYPDGWTDIGEWIDSKGKVHKTSDAARYKALGNSIALPPWKWVLKRLCACYERDATLASLFDGIGGFPLIWERINGKGTCLWASEIEEFPIAVTKARIGE